MKIEIKKQKLSDAKELHNLFNDKKVIRELCGYQYPCSLKKIESEIKETNKNWKSKKAYCFTILVDGKIAGNTILENPSKDNGRYDLGFWLGRKYWDQGVMTEAVKQTIKFGFDKLNLYRIQSDNDSDNPASGKVMKKAGMKLEGIQRKIQKKGNKFIDLYLWGITK